MYELINHYAIKLVMIDVTKVAFSVILKYVKNFYCQQSKCRRFVSNFKLKHQNAKETNYGIVHISKNGLSKQRSKVTACIF